MKPSTMAQILLYTTTITSNNKNNYNKINRDNILYDDIDELSFDDIYENPAIEYNDEFYDNMLHIFEFSMFIDSITNNNHIQQNKEP